jgi:hypothetical protein
MSDTDIDYGGNEIEGNDEKIESDDTLQQDNETATKGAYHVKQKHHRTADHETAEAIALDDDVLPAPESQEEAVEVRRGKTAEDDEERETMSLRSDKIAKQLIKDKLTAAKKSFDFGLLKEKKTPSNDNFKPIVSWPLMNQLTRPHFEPDKERRAKLIVTARYIRELIDLANADSLGEETDCDIQRTESGRVHFDYGMSLDRKKRTYDGNRNGEQGAVRHDGPVRKAKYVVPIGSRINRSDPFQMRQLAAREELNVIIAAVGPLWPSLFAAESENATLTDIGLALGVNKFQASREGTRIIRLALTAAMEALGRLNEVKDEPRRTAPLPDKSRGSFRNQARGPVIKVAS